ncbi:putative ribonuclease H-like domain-containing protein, partial [Tanacetum coccineum]
LKDLSRAETYMYFVKELKFNLFSISQMCDKKNSVLFTDTECIVLSPDFKLLNENHVLLRVPRKDNMYSVDLKNIVPSGGLTCLFANATVDESNLWHRRLGHINLDTMNKLMRGNLVRGLPSKIFENNHTCVACQKGKQHKASCKTKTVSSISQPLQMLHMDLFGPTFVKSLMKKMYCLVVTDNYSRVFNSRTRIVEENMNVKFSEATPNIAGNGPNWLFDIDALTKYLNYKPVVVGNQTNGNTGTKENIDAGQAGKKIVSSREYILLPLLTSDQSLSKGSKDSPDDGFKPSGDEEKKDSKDLGNEDSEVPSTKELRINQEKDANVNSTNNINTASDGNNTNNVNTISSTVNAAGLEDNAAHENIVYGCDDDSNMPNLEEITNSDDDVDVGAEADMNNLNTWQQRINHKDFQNYMFAYFLSQVEPKKVIQALTDLSWIKAMQDELLQFKLQKRNKKDDKGIMVRNKARLVAQGYTHEEGIDYDEVFAPVARIETIRLFLAYASFMNFIVYQMDVKSAFLYGIIEKEVYVCQPLGFEDPESPNKVYKVEKNLYGLHQAPRAWYETLSTYLLENGFRRGTIDKICLSRRTKVKQKDDGIFISQDIYVADILKKIDFATVKTTSTPMETNKALLKDEEAACVDVHLYRSMIGSLMYLTASRPDIMFVVCACARFQVTPKTSHFHAVKRIFRYLKGHLKLSIWYPRDSPFDLEAFFDCDYAGASLDWKSTTGGCQFLGRRLISWQCKKKTIVANSTTKAEYVAAAN